MNAAWRESVLNLVRQMPEERVPFEPGKTPVPVSGKVIGAREVELMTEAVLDAWLTSGRFNDQFERNLGEYLGVRHVLTVNSGSSANLLALARPSTSLLSYVVSMDRVILFVSISFM